jgi:hypothetical protein
MTTRKAQNCNDVIDLRNFCIKPLPNLCPPRSIPIPNQPPFFFGNSTNNPQFILTQAGKFSFLANPVSSSRRRTTILIPPPTRSFMVNGRSISLIPPITNNLF